MDTETKERILREAIKNIDNPWRNLTVKDVAQDLMMGENLANLLFKREDFPSVNIGKTNSISIMENGKTRLKVEI